MLESRVGRVRTRVAAAEARRRPTQHLQHDNRAATLQSLSASFEYLRFNRLGVDVQHIDPIDTRRRRECVERGDLYFHPVDVRRIEVRIQ